MTFDLPVERRMPLYPPYNTQIFEEFFMDWWEKNKEGDREFLSIPWTNLYWYGKRYQFIQDALNKVPKGKYFVVCGHDDAPREKLPEDTLVFYAGGNAIGDIAIPTISQGICKGFEYHSKSHLVSFVGADTHPIRGKIKKMFSDTPGYAIHVRDKWTHRITEDEQQLFMEVTKRSNFTLCPRGYGLSSYRLYEAMKLGSIPVYISDRFLLPFQDELDWNRLAVIVPECSLCFLKEILSNISYSQVQNMRSYIWKVYEDYFSYEGAAQQIKNRLLKWNV